MRYQISRGGQTKTIETENPLSDDEIDEISDNVFGKPATTTAPKASSGTNPNVLNAMTFGMVNAKPAPSKPSGGVNLNAGQQYLAAQANAASGGGKATAALPAQKVNPQVQQQAQATGILTKRNAQQNPQVPRPIPKSVSAVPGAAAIGTTPEDVNVSPLNSLQGPNFLSALGQELQGVAQPFAAPLNFLSSLRLPGVFGEELGMPAGSGASFSDIDKAADLSPDIANLNLQQKYGVPGGIAQGILQSGNALLKPSNVALAGVLGPVSEAGQVAKAATGLGFGVPLLAGGGGNLLQGVGEGNVSQATEGLLTSLLGTASGYHAFSSGKSVAGKAIDENGNPVPVRLQNADNGNVTVQIPKRGDVDGQRVTIPTPQMPDFLTKNGLRIPGTPPKINADLTDAQPGQTFHATDGTEYRLMGGNKDTATVRNDATKETFKVPRVPVAETPAPAPEAAPTAETPAQEAPIPAPVQAGEAVNPVPPTPEAVAQGTPAQAETVPPVAEVAPTETPVEPAKPAYTRQDEKDILDAMHKQHGVGSIYDKEGSGQWLYPNGDVTPDISEAEFGQHSESANAIFKATGKKFPGDNTSNLGKIAGIGRLRNGEDGVGIELNRRPTPEQIQSLKRMDENRDGSFVYDLVGDNGKKLSGDSFRGMVRDLNKVWPSEDTTKTVPAEPVAAPQTETPPVNAETPPIQPQEASAPVTPETPPTATEAPTQAAAPLPQTTAGKNAASEAERAQHGLAPVEKQAYTGIQQGLEEGKAQYEKDPIGTARLVDDIKTNPRTLKPAENGAIVEYKQNLLAHAEQLRKALDAAIDAKDTEAIPQLRQAYAEAQAGIGDATEALTKAGREWSAAGQARKGSVQIDYANATDAVMEARRMKGEDLKPTVEKDIAATADALKAVQDKIDAVAPKPRQQQNRAAQGAKPLPSDFGSKNTVFTADRGQAAIQRIQDALKAGKSDGKLSANVDPTKGLLDRVDVSDLVEAGGYLLEGGLRKFGDWVGQMRAVVGNGLSDALAQHVWAQVKAEAQQLPGAKTIPAPSNLTELLGKRMGWQKAAAFLDAIRDENGAPKILDKLISGDNLTAAERVQVAKAYANNAPTRAGSKTPTMDAMNTLSEIVNEGREVSRPQRMADIQSKIDDIKQQLESGNLKPLEKRTPGQMTPEQQELQDLQKQLAKERRFQNPPAVTDAEIQANAADPQKAQEAKAAEKRIDDLKLQTAELQRALDSPAELTKWEARQAQAKVDRQAKADAVPVDVQKLMQQRDYLTKQVQAKIEAQKPTTLLQRAVQTSRQFKLSGLSVFAKLGGASLWAPPVEALADMFSVPFSKLPAGGGKSLGDVSAREGAFSPKAELKGAAKMVSPEAVRNARDTILNGFNSIDAQSGKDLHVDNANEGPLKYIGRLHGAMKSFLQTGQFHKALSIRLEKAKAAGVDLNDPEEVAKIGMGAAIDAQNVKLQGDNKLADVANRIMGLPETMAKTENNPVTKASLNTLSAVMRTLAPIVKIPANYIGRAVDMTGLGVARGAVTHAIALRDAAKAGEPIPADVADNILKAYKYGSMGLVAAYLGLSQPQWFKSRGFYSQGANYGTKEDGAPAQASELQIGNKTIPHVLSHNPFLEAVQFWATVRRGMEQSKAETGAGRIGSGGYQALRGLAEEVPGMESTVQIGQALKDEGSGAKAAGQYVKSLAIPQVVQQGSKLFDKDAQGNVIQREQKGFTQSVQEGLPYFRNQLPVKGSAGKTGGGSIVTVNKKTGAVTVDTNKVLPKGVRSRR